MMKDIPHIPPRPQRERNNQISSTGSELPKVPPRPNEKRSDRSISPYAVSITQSPLNEIHSDLNNYHELSTGKNQYDELSDVEIYRPPSVKLPSLGQEGIEYADAYATEMDLQKKTFIKSQLVNTEDKNHAPNPTIPNPNIEENLSIKPTTSYSQSLQKEKHSEANDTVSKQNHPHTRPASQNAGPNSSSVSNENGIPQIGQIVPMYPNAGDVQAPSKSLEASLATSTLSNDGGTQLKHHDRKLGGRPHDIPPDVYGRFGHGIISHDRFDKEYYKKHPELIKKETRSYGEDRSEWALSSEDLNKIVRDTASRTSGNDGSTINFGTPSEQIGFQASEEYASRLSSSRPSLSRQITSLSNPESKHELPLVTGLSTNTINPILKNNISQPEQDMNIDRNHMDSDSIIHVDDPVRSNNRARGDLEDDMYSEAVEKGSNNEENDHPSYGAPILAPDEVAKEPLLWELKPAVSPLNENAKISQEESIYQPETGHQAIYTQKGLLSKVENECNLPDLESPSSAPLEKLDEYEPLFPEDAKSVSIEPKSVNLMERLKRPEMNRKFPSQDVWEDTPNSLQYTATVSALQSPEDEINRENREEKTSRDIETIAHAFAKRQEELAQQEMDRLGNSHPQEKPKKKFTAIQKTDPEAVPKFPNQRFPSRDIWEDTPDSLLLQTTVTGPQIGKDNVNLIEEQQDPTATEELTYKTFKLPLNNESDKNTELSPALRSSSADELSKLRSSDYQEQLLPLKPERPTKSLQMNFTGRSSSPSSTRPKPQVPARPLKSTSRESPDNLIQKTSPIPATSIKCKPPVPSRPIGSKIAALQGDFMSDLSKRLQLGPHASKKDVSKAEQQQEENIFTPLADVRKCRARGPARRAPVKALMHQTPDKVVTPESNPLKVLHCNVEQGNDIIFLETTDIYSDIKDNLAQK